MAINYALPVNGATATASSTNFSEQEVGAVINGLRHVNNSPDSGDNRWVASGTSTPQWVEIDFGQSRTINEVDVFALRDAYSYNTAPTLSESSTINALKDFQVQYWNGSSWVDIVNITNNDKIWKQFTFSPLSTTKIRVYVTAMASTINVCIVEIEAWGDHLAITTDSPLPGGIVGASYSKQLEADGGVGSLSWENLTSLPSGLSLSSSGLFSSSPSISGSFSITIKVTDSVGATDEKTFSLEIEEAPELPYGFTQQGVELFCEANQMSQSNGSNVPSFTDISVHARHLTAPDTYPTFQTGVVNGKPVVRWNGSKKPLSVTATFQIKCGWIVAKYNGSSFPDYKGLLSDLTTQSILVSNNTENNWYNAGYEIFEYRLNDRIYPESEMPAPMNAFNLMFFRFWKPFTVSGVMLGQDRDFTTRKWDGDVALLILSSRNYFEPDIRARSAEIAASYNLTLADVYPYQASRKDAPESPEQSVNIYDPPEGDRIAEVLDDPKLSMDLKFNARRQDEVKAMKNFHRSHYPEVPFLYRDYKFYPPVDIEGYFNSMYDLNGSLNNFNYSFQFKEK